MSDGDEQATPGDAAAAAQVVITDVRRMMSPVFGNGFGDNRRSGFNKSNFESRELNDLVDMVEGAKPDELEAVGDALEKAAEEIEKVGADFGKYVKGVDWEGEAGESFRTWGDDLAKNTAKLADFTSTVSTQMKAAALGLSMVKGSMPPRDDGGPGAEVSKIPAPARVESNKEYTEAKAADAAAKEKLRQEAIGQMNKLSSYYQVSHDTMYGQEAPVFKPMPNVGMPPPPSVAPRDPGVTTAGDAVSSSGVTSVSRSGALPGTVSESVGSERGDLPDQVPPTPETQVRTEIDSVTAPQKPTGPPLNTPPPTNTQPGPQPSPIVGPAPQPPPPRPNLNRQSGPPSQKVGRSPVSNGGKNLPTSRGPQTPTGRGPITGQGNGQPLGRPTSTGPGPMGRPPSSTMPPRSMGRNAPIVGGTQRTSGPSNTPRIPRGMVVGGEQGAMGRPPGSGLVGGRGLAASGGAGSGSGRGARPFTPGGTGLARGGMGTAPRGQRSFPRERERDDSRRPDYLVEDESTWTRGRGDSAPPVIE
ncbi:WXG100 family type VII secretion target [Streptomyces sp. JJ36]|uniref:WXG100 family type VII secretion target n=1 Tax=Streptomyces sp. JJ36 TaxID=2736645 RepID=UPI001F1BAA9C|nr:WXG100 family type VII secretion target [Streptomyces sp. JJ36]MCF6524911.1 hypothetical protein [Streptomyces sp. JJ36]